MKIISNYVDFYDDVSKIHGVDESLVLNRAKADNPTLYHGDTFEINIGGTAIPGVKHNKKIYWGHDILNLPESQIELKDNGEIKITFEHIGKNSHYYVTNYIKYIHKQSDLNSFHSCPIILRMGYRTFLFPKLNDLSLQNYLDAEEAWKLIYDWLKIQSNIKKQRELFYDYGGI